MAEKKKALLIKLSSLGDIIFNIPLANALQKSGYEVHWLVSEKGIDVLKGNPCIDRMIVAPFYKWKRQGFFKSFGEFIDILKFIRKQKYDVLIDTQGRWRSLVFSIFSGVKKRLAGSDEKEFSRFGATEIVKIPSGWNINIVDKYLLFAKHLGIEGNPYDMTLPDTSGKEDKINSFLKDIDSNKPLAVLSPSTTWKTKYWDKDNWIDLVDKISGRFNIVFTGTEKDIEYINFIRKNYGINLAGKTDILE
ncbi:glycosyltransferase family 9 protein, partial [bacterium]|nr:glycosyltransferase family 9 protein [bacterium]